MKMVTDIGEWENDKKCGKGVMIWKKENEKYCGFG